MVEKSAGVGAGFPDADYAAAGGTIVSHAQSWDSDLVVKVKEPDEEEYQYFKPGQVVWGFQHFGLLTCHRESHASCRHDSDRRRNHR